MNVSTRLRYAGDDGHPGNERHPTWSPSGGRSSTSPRTMFAVNPAGGVSPQNLNVDGRNRRTRPTGRRSPSSTRRATSCRPRRSHLEPVRDDDRQQRDVRRPDWQAVEAPSGGGSGAPTNVAYPGSRSRRETQAPSSATFSSRTSARGTARLDLVQVSVERCDAADPVNGPCVDIVGATRASSRPSRPTSASAAACR
jgi:hypothetical protein